VFLHGCNRKDSKYMRKNLTGDAEVIAERNKIVMLGDCAPILLFAFNRPRHLLQTLAALKKNLLAEQSDLIIYSDAAKNPSDQLKVDQVRQSIRLLDGFKSIRVIERKNNYGLAKNIIEGVTETLNQYGRAIILEDDMLTSPYFLTYMNQALQMYEEDEIVASIHAYVYPVKVALPDTFFLKGADCWGWATWKRAWDTFETDGKKLLAEIDAKGLKDAFNLDNGYDYYKMLQQQVRGKNNSWAVRWYASCFLKNMLTLYPGASLVNNIGFDNSGTHCSYSNDLTVHIAESINLQPILKQEDTYARAAISRFLRAHSSVWARLLRRLFK